MKRRVKLAIAILVFMGASLVTLILYLTSATSLFEVIYYGLTGNKIVDQEEVSDNSQNTYAGPYYDELHRAICNLDMNKIPIDAELGLTHTDFTIPGWTIHSYLETYKLFAEICARPEINPPGEVKITPADLWGMMMNETGGQCYSSFSSYIVWEQGESGSYLGPFEQTELWSQIDYATPNSGSLAIYISWEENAELPLDQRVFYGLPGQLGNNQGILVNSETMEQLVNEGASAFKSNTVSTSDIQSKLTVGQINSGNQNTQSRPNSRLFTDAAYSAALNLRFSLYGLDRYTLAKASYGSGHAIDLFENLVDKSGAADNFDNASKALAIMLNGGQWGYTKINESLETSGGEVYAYGVMTDSSIDFIGMKDISESERKSYLIAPGQTDFKLLWGATPAQAGEQYTFSYPHDGLLGDYGIADRVASDMQTYADNWEVWQTYFYGYRAVNNGYEMDRVARRIGEYAIGHDDWMFSEEHTPPSDGEGEEGGNVDIPDAGESNTCAQGHGYCGSLLGNRFTDKTSGFLLSKNDFPNTSNLDSVDAGSEPIPGLFPNPSFDYKGHNGMDYQAAAGTPVGAVQEGYVISMGGYPKTTFSWDQAASAGGTDPAHWMGTYVTVAHNGGYTIYAHLSGIAHIQPGQYVAKGQTIGYVGTTGNSSGNHLHVTWGRTIKLQVAGWIPGTYFYPEYGRRKQ